MVQQYPYGGYFQLYNGRNTLPYPGTHPGFGPYTLQNQQYAMYSGVSLQYYGGAQEVQQDGTLCPCRGMLALKEYQGDIKIRKGPVRIRKGDKTE